MARIVALSSQVARGHVGLRALVPALESFGHDVIALPTIVLSSHAAFPHLAGTQVSTALMSDMADALDTNGWLASVDAIVTGYLPSAFHVDFAVSLIQRIRRNNPRLLVICDPVLGDEPKGLYLPQDAALRIKQNLVPLAGVITPNAFELSWLAGVPIDGLASATRAAETFAGKMVLATSIPAPPDHLATFLRHEAKSSFTSVPRRPRAPSGTGDLLTGLFAGALTAGLDSYAALAQSGAQLEWVLSTSATADDLTITSLYRRPGADGLPVFELS